MVYTAQKYADVIITTIKMRLIISKYEKWINNIDSNELLQEKNNIIVSNQKHSQIYCLTTNEIFYSFRDAAGAYNIKQMDNIRMCCLKKAKSCGKGKNGEKLIWMYYEDYKELLNTNCT